MLCFGFRSSKGWGIDAMLGVPKFPRDGEYCRCYAWSSKGGEILYSRSCYAGGSEVLYKGGGLELESMSGGSGILRGKGRVLKMREV
jgi:hypothetical protein